MLYGLNPVFRPRASQLFAGTARRGAAWMPLVGEGAGSPFRQPLQKGRSAGSGRNPGVFSFGCFSLDKQRKVSRLSVREPTSKLVVAIATPQLEARLPETLSLIPAYFLKITQLISNPHQILLRIHPRLRRPLNNLHQHPLPLPKYPQLLQTLDTFQLRS